MNRTVDEEALAEGLAPEVRRERGAYFTPRGVVELALELVAPYVPSRGALTVIDPACGAGAFLAAAAERWPRAALAGVELERASATECRARVPSARVVEGDAIAGTALERALDGAPAGGFELWVGNPPYNGTSPLLKDARALARALSFGPPGLELASGRSLREDFVFFLLRASHRLAERKGALAFVTSATVLDAFLYAPIRRALLERLALREVADLGAGAFRGTRVRTCITVWTTARDRARPRFQAVAEADADTLAAREELAALARASADSTWRGRRPKRTPTSADVQALPPVESDTRGPATRSARRGEDARSSARSSRGDSGQLPLFPQAAPGSADVPSVRRALGIEFEPAEPTLELRPPPDAAAALERRWREEGEPLTAVVPVSLPGLKTRFDELLVDDDPSRLMQRVREFLACPEGSLDAFARRWSLGEALLPKLQQTREFAAGAEPAGTHVRAFLRYRGPLPMGPAAFCYVDRRLIPRGDHRFRGEYDPHAHPVKLVFNVHELPLWSRVLDTPGCVTAYRHSRFAPLMVPQRIRDEGIAVARTGEALGPLVPNLSPRGLAWAQRIGGPQRVFEAIAKFVTSHEVQEVWAPAYGASRVVAVPCAER